MSFKPEPVYEYVLWINEVESEIILNLTKEEANSLNKSLKEGKINNIWKRKS